LVVLIALVAVAFIATSCTKKQVIKEEAVAKPVVEAKPTEEAPTPYAAAPVEKPKEEAKIVAGEEVKVYSPKEKAVAPEKAKIVPGEEVKVYAPKEEEAKVPEIVPQEEAKVPEIGLPEMGLKEEAKEEVKEEAKIVPREEVKVYAPKEEAALPKEKIKEEAKEEAKVPEIVPQEEAKEEAKVPEIAPKEEPKIERKVEARPEEKPAPFDLAGLRIQFAFDDFNLSSKAKENLEKVASWMSKNPAAKIQIEGHTCEVGTNEYNLALGERRANSAKRYLEGLGVSSRRISTISYGEERPLDPGHTEDARSKNRRDEFVGTR
jgi:peptidoglycan-associated lipoprotein